jgi:SWIM zinc finger
MAGPAIDHVYSYTHPSALEWMSGGAQLRLATSGGPEAHPYFFRGCLLQPRRTADLLLAVSRVVQSRFNIPTATLSLGLDPVVTCGMERVRFEGFSTCCSTYARVDLLPEAVDGDLLARGTTNVDFNPPMRAALARIRDSETVRLSVGGEAVDLETETGAVTERKVPLPTRWIKGFVEVQAYQARMDLRLEVSGAEARRFLRALPRQGMQGKPAWVVPSGNGLRLSQVAGRGGVRVTGVERLRVLEDLAHHARALRVYSEPDGEASAWELVMDGARFHLVLSPEVWRGFSGEGQVLSQLADGLGADALARVRAALHWGPRLDVGALVAECGLDPAAVRAALAHLGASGLVGYDLSEGAYFHRELPFNLSLIDSLQPRLRDARRLVDEDGVRIERTGEEGVEAWVRGTDVEHRVRLTPEGARCTCPWYAKHQGERGPCKHVLAVQIVTGGEDDA